MATRWRAVFRRLDGRRVRARDGVEVGRVSGLAINLDDGDTLLRVSGNGDMLVPWALIEVDDDADAVVVRCSATALATAPRFADARLMTLDQYERLRRHYGLAGNGRRGRIRALRSFLAPATLERSVVAGAPQVAIRRIFRRFWPHARPYRRLFLLSLVLVALAPAVDAATLWLFKLVVDDVLVPHSFAPLIPIGAVYLALTVLDGAITFLDDYVSTWVEERFLLDLRNGFFDHLTRLSLDFFERRRLGDILARLTGDLAAIESFVISSVADTASYGIRILIYAGAMFYLRWDLALVSLTVAPVFWLMTRRFSGLIKQASRERRRRSGAITAVAEESLANIMLVQAMNAEGAESERFRRENEGSFAATMAATRLTALFSPLIDVIRAGGLMIVFGMGTWELSSGRLSLGGLLLFLTYLSQLYSPLRRLAGLSNSVFAATAAADRVVEFLEQEPNVRENERPRRLRRARGHVALEGVSFRYPGVEQDALVDIDLEVERGETLALVGASGAGKSTIAKLLLRFYDPQAGSVRLDGIDLRALRLADLRTNVSVVLQETLVLDGTVRSNILYGRPGASERTLVRAAKLADAHDFIRALPDGYDTVVGQRGRRLSGGQRQRIAIARAMIRNAPVLILDEPTTGLDVESSWRILDPLRRLMEGRSTIVISHNLLTVREASRIAVLDHGRIVETGTHAELRALGGRYAELSRERASELVVPPDLEEARSSWA